MSDDTQQPAPKKPMTPAERQRASRAARKKERFNTCPAKQISIMLSAEASQALEQLVFESDKSQKEIIEKLLIETQRRTEVEKEAERQRTLTKAAIAERTGIALELARRYPHPTKRPPPWKCP